MDFPLQVGVPFGRLVVETVELVDVGVDVVVFGVDVDVDVDVGVDVDVEMEVGVDGGVELEVGGDDSVDSVELEVGGPSVAVEPPREPNVVAVGSEKDGADTVGRPRPVEPGEPDDRAVVVAACTPGGGTAAPFTAAPHPTIKAPIAITPTRAEPNRLDSLPFRCEGFLRPVFCCPLLHCPWFRCATPDNPSSPRSGRSASADLHSGHR